MDEYLMEAMMCMLVPHTHSLTDEVCKPVRTVNNFTSKKLFYLSVGGGCANEV